MFAKSKRVDYESYERRRSRRRVPRWALVLLIGMAIGAVVAVVVQERYLPPRLSADASVKLRSAFEEADAERLRLKGELGEIKRGIETAHADKKGVADELAASRVTAERLRDDVTSVVGSLPPDPRGGVVEVRAGRFTAKGGMLAYDVVLTRERAGGKPLAGVMQLVVTGESARGAESTVTLEPVTLSVGSYEIVRGNLPLPEGFRPRQTTIQVLDRVAGKPLGMRVMLVQ
jgi:hypothetical protein